MINVLLISLILLAGCREFNNKTEYAAIQVVEDVERQNLISKLEIRRRGEYILAGFRADNGKVNTWVLLNPKHSPYYKQIPQVQFTVTLEDLEEIRHIEGVSETVIAVLETRVVRP